MNLRISKILVFSAVLGAGVLFAVGVKANNPALEENEKCERLLDEADTTDPELYATILNCELNEDDETFASAGGLGFGGSDLSRSLLTGNDITLTNNPSGGGGGSTPDPDPTPDPGPGPTPPCSGNCPPIFK